jgi:hypothetical protein
MKGCQGRNLVRYPGMLSRKIGEYACTCMPLPDVDYPVQRLDPMIYLIDKRYKLFEERLNP